jgi:zinc and cadmium transporter
VLPQPLFDRVVLALVALAAGSLLGGALFHLLPESVAALGNGTAVHGWLGLGIVVFVVLEQFLDRHHCHRAVSRHRPLGYLVLVADGLHNLIGGLAVGSAFVVDVRLGVVTGSSPRRTRSPQELGDFGLLVHSGWSRARALVFNVLSALTFLVESVAAYALAGQVDVTVLLPFAAGTFVYIAVADLLPEVTADRPVTARSCRASASRSGSAGCTSSR